MFEWLRHWRFGNQYGYERFFRGQDRRMVGKTGIILADLGMPGIYKADFYIKFMEHVFDYSLPFFLKRFILADRGIALIDPSNPLAREKFVPRLLVDMYGSSINKSGRPYIECDYSWRPPGMKKNPSDHGYFLYTGDGKGGAPEVCQKTAAKVAGWYFAHLLPEKKVPWEHQCGKIYEDAAAILKNRYPETELRHMKYASEESMVQTIEDLIEYGCQTIVYQCFCNPVYSDFEDYAYTLPALHSIVNGRAKVICADQLGNQPSMREAYIQMIRDQLKNIPHSSRILLILSKHGHPFKQETSGKRGPEYRIPLEREMINALKEWGGEWDLVWSDDEYADEYWDPRRKKFSTISAYRKAIEEEYDLALEVPTDFIAENTDLMIFHAMKKFKAFREYDPYLPVYYPDWEIPLVRTFSENKTTGKYIGCPVGPYRKFVVDSIISSISDLLNGYANKA